MARARTVLVTGSAGRLGRAVSAELLARGHRVRRLPHRERQLRAGEWQEARRETRVQAQQLRGQLVALVGLGAIGREVARRVRGFEAQVRYYDLRLATPANEAALGVRFQELDALLAEADVVSLHVPLTAATRRLLSRERIGRLKPGAIVINTARGELVDEAALAEALDAGTLAGAGIDVFGGEPPPPDHPLLRVSPPGLVLTSHLAGSDFDNVTNVARDVFRNIQRVLDGHPLPEADLVSSESES
jgi:phosphoglycerate dehydrogenase-like enzyme